MSTDWQQRHSAALLYPSDQERPIVQLVSAIDTMSKRYATDYFMRRAVAELITAAIELLNADHGPRLDMGSLDSQLRQCARRIRFSVDQSRFDDCTTD